MKNDIESIISKEYLFKRIKTVNSQIWALFMVFLFVFLLSSNINSISNMGIKLALWAGVIIHNVAFFFAFMELRRKKKSYINLLEKTENEEE